MSWIAKNANCLDRVGRDFGVEALAGVLPQLPTGCLALVQKPLGMNLAEAGALAAILKDREVTAALNFQLQFTPAMVAVGEALARGLMGDVVDVEVRLVCKTPWA